MAGSPCLGCKCNMQNTPRHSSAFIRNIAFSLKRSYSFLLGGTIFNSFSDMLIENTWDSGSCHACVCVHARNRPERSSKAFIFTCRTSRHLQDALDITMHMQMCHTIRSPSIGLGGSSMLTARPGSWSMAGPRMSYPYPKCNQDCDKSTNL